MAKIEFESEKELEDFIFEACEEGACPLSGSPVDLCFRQVDLGAYGIVDILKIEVYPNGGMDVTVLELKKEHIGVSAVAQVSRYMEGIKHYLNETPNLAPENTGVYGEVAAPSLKDDSVHYLLNLLQDDIKYYEIGCSLRNGFEASHRQCWHKTKPRFPDLSLTIREIKRVYIEKIRCIRGHEKRNLDHQGDKGFDANDIRLKV